MVLTILNDDFETEDRERGKHYCQRIVAVLISIRYIIK